MLKACSQSIGRARKNASMWEGPTGPEAVHAMFRLIVRPARRSQRQDRRSRQGDRAACIDQTTHDLSVKSHNKSDQVALRDFRQEGDKVLQAAAEAINRPRHNNIELTARCRQRIECWPLFFVQQPRPNRG